MSGNYTVEYSKNTFCGRCGITQPLGLFRCTECNNLLRTHGMRRREK